MRILHSSDQVTRFIGIDVASRSFVAAVDGRRPRSFSMDETGVQELLDWLAGKDSADLPVAVMEHTGAYSRCLAAMLAEHGIDSVLVDPRRVRDYACSQGIRTKTDNVDARAILSFAQHFKPVNRVQRSMAEQQLSVLLGQRSLLVRQRAMLKRQLASVTMLPGNLEAGAAAMLSVQSSLDASIAELDRLIDCLIREDERLSKAFAILMSIPGIGRVNAAMLCARLSVIEDCSAAELTALVGLSPKHRQSGNMQGRSRIDKQGWSGLRRTLYMSALAAVRSDDTLAEFRQRLIDRGKPKILAAVAVARKLLVISHALIRKQEMYVSQPKAA